MLFIYSSWQRFQTPSLPSQPLTLTCEWRAQSRAPEQLLRPGSAGALPGEARCCHRAGASRGGTRCGSSWGKGRGKHGTCPFLLLFCSLKTLFILSGTVLGPVCDHLPSRVGGAVGIKLQGPGRGRGFSATLPAFLHVPFNTSPVTGSTFWVSPNQFGD